VVRSTESNKMKNWYKVTRHDGNIEYATKSENGWCLGGSGWVYKHLDAMSIEPIDELPQDEVETYVGFDITEIPYKAIVDMNDTWNGWLKPYIHKDDVVRMLEDLSGDWMRWTIEDGVISIMDSDVGYDVVDTIEISHIGDQQYYYFGNLGWCFQPIDNNN